MLGSESFLVPSDPMAGAFAAPDSRRGVGVHLQKIALAERALVAGGRGAPVARSVVRRWRARASWCWQTLEMFLPFVERHYLFVDSPHDGRPAWDYRGAARVEDVDRTALRAGGASVDVEPMASRWEVSDDEILEGLGGEPLRTALGNAYVVGSSVLPALGQEGELLAAWSVARIITRTDRRREKMRRDMWSKVELG